MARWISTSLCAAVALACGGPVDEFCCAESYGSGSWISGPPVELGSGTNLRQVALAGSRLAVAADDRVRVFDRTSSGWIHDSTINAPQPGLFGANVALSGDTIILRDVVAGGQTVVRIFRRSKTFPSWTQEALLLPPPGSGQQSFGGALAIDGDVAVIGMSYANTKKGQVFVYRRTGARWSLAQTLTSGLASSVLLFGSAVRLTEGSLLVAMPAGYQPGKVFAYRESPRGHFDLEATLDDPSPQPVPQPGGFGQRIGFDGTWLVVRSDFGHRIFQRTVTSGSVQWADIGPWNVADDLGLDISNGIAAIGRHHPNLADVEEVRLFRLGLGSPTYLATLTEPVQSSNWFGSQIHIDSGLVAVRSHAPLQGAAAKNFVYEKQ